MKRKYRYIHETDRFNVLSDFRVIFFFYSNDYTVL
jgi:hypothetical protein